MWRKYWQMYKQNFTRLSMKSVCKGNNDWKESEKKVQKSIFGLSIIWSFPKFPNIWYIHIHINTKKYTAK